MPNIFPTSKALQKTLPAIADNNGKVKVVAKNIAKFHENRIINRAKHLSEVKKILSNEQYDTFIKHIADRYENRKRNNGDRDNNRNNRSNKGNKNNRKGNRGNRGNNNRN